MQGPIWHNADEEIPGEDEALCILCIDSRHEADDGPYRIRRFEVGYIFADNWYDERDHEKVECHWRKVTHWMEIPEAPE